MAIFFIRKNFELTSNVTYPCRSREVVMHTYLPKKISITPKPQFSKTQFPFAEFI